MIVKTPTSIQIIFCGFCSVKSFLKARDIKSCVGTEKSSKKGWEWWVCKQIFVGCQVQLRNEKCAEWRLRYGLQSWGESSVQSFHLFIVSCRPAPQLERTPQSCRVSFGLGVDYVAYGRFNDGDGENGVSSSWITLAVCSQAVMVDPENLCEGVRV